MEFLSNIIVLLLMLSVLVLIHELGHFFVAKKLGIKVEEFGFGFPPRMFGIKRGETIYSVNWLPIGGFVKLYGEDEAGGGKPSKKDPTDVKGKDLKRAFFARNPWQRASVVVAGVVMNAILAVIIFYIYLGLTGFKAELPLLSPQTFIGANQCTVKGVIINEVVPNSPAAEAGISDCSSVISVNNKKLSDSSLGATEFIDTINENKGKEISLTWQDGESGKVTTSVLTPRVNPPKDQGALGVGIGYTPFSVAVLSYDTPLQKAFSGFSQSINVLWWNLGGLIDLVKTSLSERDIAPVSKGVGGPIAIGSFVGVILQIPDLKMAILQLLNLAGLLSVFLAFFNILPIPALDGGRLFFILIEGVTGKKVDPKVEGIIHSIGMTVLLAFMLLVTLKDFKQFIFDSLPFVK